MEGLEQPLALTPDRAIVRGWSSLGDGAVNAVSNVGMVPTAGRDVGMTKLMLYDGGLCRVSKGGVARERC